MRGTRALGGAKGGTARMAAAVVALGISGASIALLAVGGAGAAQGPAMTATGELTPTELPRSWSPASVTVGFTSEEPGSIEVPRLARMSIELSRNVRLQTRDLPTCTEARLFAGYRWYRQPCRGALVGTGTVDSEIELRREEPLEVRARLRAYYAEERGRRLILAEATSQHPPLTWVIPFTIRRASGPFHLRLLVPKRRMSHLRGKCAKGHPECFGTPYTLEGIYSHISNLSMTLHRFFPREGRRASFVRARCPAGRQHPIRRFPLDRVALSYVGGAERGATAHVTCRFAGP